MPGIPNVGLRADSDPNRTECGVGALMPWADGLYATTYNNAVGTGTGLGLFRIDDQLKLEKIDVTYGMGTNRMMHRESNQCIIGPYVIDSGGKCRFIESLGRHRLTATMRHLTDPANRVYFQTMEGLFFEMDISTLKTTLLFNLVKEMNITQPPHFKGGCTAQGRVVVSNNGYYAYGDVNAGLFEWDGVGPWKRISNKPHMDCAARENMGEVIFTTGWDESSVLFSALVEGQWQNYRLPLASHATEQAWQTEWMRIREVETERYMMDIQGMFYELQPVAFEGRIWGVKPVCQHLRTIPDYCPFRGMLALGGNEGSPNREHYKVPYSPTATKGYTDPKKNPDEVEARYHNGAPLPYTDANVVAGQPQSGIWFGKLDDLWSWGRPQGWGGPWRNTMVQAEVPSDPYLMTGFEHKGLHLVSDSAVSVGIEIDFMGNGTWEKYEKIKLNAGEYKFFPFLDAFSAQWVRLVPSDAAKITAEFIYT